MSRISCVILNYNDVETTISLLDHIYKFDCLDKIVIVDNRSTDNSYKILKNRESDKIIVLLSDKNGGYGYGNNIGIRYSYEKLHMDYCLIANPDVVFENNFVRSLANFLDHHKRYALITGIQIGPTESAWKEPTLIGDVIFNSLVLNKIFRPRYYPRNYFNQEICDVYAVPGCLFLARISALYEIGLYDEDFFLFEEEKVLAKKLKNKNWKSAVSTNQSYIHNHSVSIKKSIKKLGQAKKLVLKSNELYLRKYCGIKGLRMILIKLFYKYAILESILFAMYRRIKK